MDNKQIPLLLRPLSQVADTAAAFRSSSKITTKEHVLSSFSDQVKKTSPEVIKSQILSDYARHYSTSGVLAREPENVIESGDIR